MNRNLERRTELFRQTPRDIESIILFKNSIRDLENPAPLIDDIHVCEFTGFMDHEQRTIGCMLHPMAHGNMGTDWRGLCHYGSMACKTFFCPACEELTDTEAGILIDLIDNWRMYGLIITDVNFVRSVFNLLRIKTGRDITKGEAQGNPAILDALYGFLSLKVSLSDQLSSNHCQSLYFVKPDPTIDPDCIESNVWAIIRSIAATYGIDPSNDLIRREVSIIMGRWHNIIKY